MGSMKYLSKHLINTLIMIWPLTEIPNLCHWHAAFNTYDSITIIAFPYKPARNDALPLGLSHWFTTIVIAIITCGVGDNLQPSLQSETSHRGILWNGVLDDVVIANY